MRRVWLIAVLLSMAAPLGAARTRTGVIANGDVPGLIAAILAANGNPGPDTISLDPGGLYELLAPYDADNGLPPITDDLTILGNGATIARSGNPGTPDFRIAQIMAAGTATFSGVTITNGRHSIGGGFLNLGSLTLRTSTLSGNAVTLYGGGVFNWPGATLVVVASTVSNNSADAFTPSGCHSCSYGGGIDSWGTLTVANSTVANNFTNFGGGGIYSNGFATIINTTIAGNTSLNYGSGILSDSSGGGTIVNSILAGNYLARNCAFGHPIASLGHNLSDGSTCAPYFNQPGDLNDTAGGLDPAGLQDNGGPTDTIALAPGSAAIDAGDDAYCASSLVAGADQRGAGRPAGPHCDIGAIEAPVADPDAPQISCATSDGLWHADDVSLACTASDEGSGLQNATDASFLLATNVAAGAEISDAQTGSHAVCDNAGNCATAGPIGGNMVDKRAPVVSLTAPAGGNYTIGQTVLASYGCSDGGSGVASCTGPVASGSPIDTSTAGSFMFTVNSVDGVGNASSASVSYTVSLGGEFSSVTPASIWLGLKNSDDVGTKFDLLAEVLKNGTVVGTGQLNAVPGGSSGFNNAVQRAVTTALVAPTSIGPGDTLSIRLSVRIAVGVPGHVSGTARLWYNDAAANSRIDAIVNGVARTFYLKSGSVLSTTPGTGPKATIDVLVNKNVGGNPFKPFGTWSLVF